MSFQFQKRHRREPLELQLTAMIDIFTMIVIFLVMGTIIGVTDVQVAPQMKLPTSISLESLDAAPQLVIDYQIDPTNQGQVTSMVQLKSLSKEDGTLPSISIKEFKNPLGEPESENVTNLKDRIRRRLEKLSPQQKSGTISLNVVADSRLPYADLYDVIKVFREAGYESLLFVAQGESKAPQELESPDQTERGP